MDRARKIYRIMWPCLAATLPLQALAAAPSNAAIGQVEAILNFCAQSNPAWATSAQRLLLKLAGPTAVVGARTTVAYKNGYQNVSTQLGTLAPAQGAALCAVLGAAAVK